MTPEKLTQIRRRLSSRLPILGRWQRRQAVQRLIADDSSAAVRELALALAQNQHTAVRDAARDALTRLEARRHINAVCKVWYEVRHPALDKLLLEKGWVATAPLDVRVYSALKVGQGDRLTKGSVAAIPVLLQACDDFDSDIATNARPTLQQVRAPAAREAVCRLCVESDHTLACQIAQEAGFLPADAAQRALFLFLTAQWARYDALDYDQRLLRTAYEGTQETVRQRVREKLRLTGRTELLTVVIGHDYRARVATMPPDELEFVLRMLHTNQAWAHLWDLAFEAPLLWSERIVQALQAANWQPPEADRALFSQLTNLATADIELTDAKITALFPLALLQAQLRVPGRVNAVAFSPTRPILAIGTGARKLVLWNYQTATVEQVLGGFAHAIGAVAFTSAGHLVCAERSNQTTAMCAIYTWDGADLIKLGQHQGAVTALEPVTNGMILSTGRDRDMALWDVAARQQIQRHTLTDWARGARVSPDGTSVLTLTAHHPSVWDVPDFHLIACGWLRSVPSCAAFLPDGTILIGRHNGLVKVYAQHNQRLNMLHQHTHFTQHSHTVRGLEVLPESNYVLSAGHEGEVRFFNATTHTMLGKIDLQGRALTALHVSPDEAFMALGDAEAQFALWDLRIHAAAAVLTHPLGQATPTAVGILEALAHNQALQPQAQKALQFVALLLRHRSRFDIELALDEAPSIMMGEFDIEIE